jgi:hypothetical protein
MERMFLVFPSVKEYLGFNSSDVSATLGEWFPILEKLEAKECHGVIEGWLFGSVPMFDQKERGYICLIVRSRVLAHRDAVSKARASVESGIEYRRIKQERGLEFADALARSLPMDMLKAIEKIIPFNKKLSDGEITEADWEREKDRIHKEYCDSFSKAGK